RAGARESSLRRRAAARHRSRGQTTARACARRGDSNCCPQPEPVLRNQRGRRIRRSQKRDDRRLHGRPGGDQLCGARLARDGFPPRVRRERRTGGRGYTPELLTISKRSFHVKNVTKFVAVLGFVALAVQGSMAAELTGYVSDAKCAATGAKAKTAAE